MMMLVMILMVIAIIENFIDNIFPKMIQYHMLENNDTYTFDYIFQLFVKI